MLKKLLSIADGLIQCRHTYVSLMEEESTQETHGQMAVEVRAGNANQTESQSCIQHKLTNGMLAGLMYSPCVSHSSAIAMAN